MTRSHSSRARSRCTACPLVRAAAGSNSATCRPSNTRKSPSPASSENACRIASACSGALRKCTASENGLASSFAPGHAPIRLRSRSAASASSARICWCRPRPGFNSGLLSFPCPPIYQHPAIGHRARRSLSARPLTTATRVSRRSASALSAAAACGSARACPASVTIGASVPSKSAAMSRRELLRSRSLHGLGGSLGHALVAPFRIAESRTLSCSVPLLHVEFPLPYRPQDLPRPHPDVIVSHPPAQAPHPLPPLRLAHRQGGMDRLGESIRGIGIDQHRFPQRARRAREFAQQQHRIVPPRRHEFLADQVHPVVQRRHDHRIRRSVPVPHLLRLHVNVQRPHRLPLRRLQDAVDPCHHPLHRLGVVAVRSHRGPARRRDVDELHPPLPLRVPLEQPLD